jgi:hypothetical protein
VSAPSDITILSRRSSVWSGARELIDKATGRLLTISRAPLRDAATRLVQEGYDPTLSVVLLDEATGQTERRLIQSALDLPPLPPDQLAVRKQQLAKREQVVVGMEAELEVRLAQIRAAVA